MELTIDMLRKLAQNDKFKWTTHVLRRLQERNINPSDIKSCIKSGEVIEQYSSDYPYPSCLILGLSMDGSFLHVVLGLGCEHLWVVTAYFPTVEKWGSDFKTRKVAGV